ncbi:acyl carrier protein [Micromonospora sp. A202]|uniref:acyl carrier protein n=1 Tax=Micromonospora sp. A202 TaxID=2572899 RepID=UPI00114FE994|nr:acyl carrier protein [Micromonospora sp. A202]TQJ23673.1 acyl carrier protein [Micromonospora sp. A202]
MPNADLTAGLDAARKQEIKTIVCDILELEEDEVSETSLFKEDHAADSLSAIEILAALERSQRVTIDQAELSRMVNLQGIYQVVEQTSRR